ncbi:MAG: 2,3-oxidosqualene cyclase [Deltaproteobacteria bacterium]|nr:MAG: 2,3-oxidosqualene cyclase [Deltaproteobacteria bacterium]
MNERVQRTYRRICEHLAAVQKPNGALAGEVIWNVMLPCQYVIVCHIVGHSISDERRRRILLQLERNARDDGGFGMHPDSPSWLFHTVLAYVAMRLLDVPADHPMAAKARAFIERHGGVAEVPTWGRIWLALLGLYPWDGVQPIVPELWLLPESSPAHPSRLYCHMRLIYLGLSYVYGTRFTAPETPIVERIRRELYPDGYAPDRLVASAGTIAATDLFEAPHPALGRIFGALRRLERLEPKALRARALDKAMDHILFEFRSTAYVCLSPVNGLLFTLALFIDDPAHPDLPKALEGLEYWVWEDDVDGFRICGARSDIWDTSFVVQALCEGPDVGPVRSVVEGGCRFLSAAQIQEEIVGGRRHHRAPAYGGWGFADERHPWPVSDCTAEALEALIAAERRDLSDRAGRLDLGRKTAAVAFVLLRQNDDGGFGSYEARRGPMILRKFNPAEIYGNCMLEYSYTECTGSCVRGLATARRHLKALMPPSLAERTDTAIAKGRAFIEGAQGDAGGWPGFWGINYTYGTMFALSGLLAAGVDRTNPRVRAAVRFLLDHQREDGGWGESYLGMLDGRDVPLAADEPSLVVQTAWALLSLLAAAPEERTAIDRGVAYLLERVGPDGVYPREKASGCFFNTAVLDYDLYRQEFPAWALARYLATYG